jgi:hypothetical protein
MFTLAPWTCDDDWVGSGSPLIVRAWLENEAIDRRAIIPIDVLA